jgi:predicted Fe-Mo cluster-binding NifX family protein
MKIAALSDDGVTISRHFGRAPYYVVVTVEDREVVDRDRRTKMGHAQFRHQGGQHRDAQGRHGYGGGAEGRHERMAATISDCQVLLCGGMGWGAYESLQAKGITPIVTDIRDIDTAVQAYLDGTIVDQKGLLH